MFSKEVESDINAVMTAADNKLPLKDFIEQNHNLLSAMAVLVAVASFATTLSVRWLGDVLLFLSIAAIVTLWIELYMSFPKTGSLRLILFKNILSFGLIGLVFYWFLAFGKFWNIFLFIPLFLMMFYMSHNVVKQLLGFSFVKKVIGEKGNRNKWQILLITGYGFGIFWAVSWMLYLAIGASPGFNIILELIRINFK